MKTEYPLLTLAMFLVWARAVTFWLFIFWSYLPFAVLARDLTEIS